MKLFGSMKIEDNELSIGGVRACDLAKEYGTPLYVYDEELIREYCRDYQKYFKCEENGNRAAFAGKSFLNIAMCRILMEENMALDVVSGGELYTAYKAGFPMEKIMFHGNNKTLEEIELGVKLGVGNFAVDNMYEIEALDKFAEKYGKVQNIFLRITPGIDAHTHDYIKTGQIDSKFGFAPVGNMIDEIVEKAIELKNVKLAGLHCHIGSQIFELEPYEDAVEIMLEHLRNIKEKYNYEIEAVDFGGGFGVYYVEGDKPKTTKEYCEAIINKVDEVCLRTGQKRPKLEIEAGRSISANAGTTLYTVGSVKEIPGVRTYAAVDGGMADNIRPSLYQAEYECAIANRIEGDNVKTVTIAGKCCESGDLLVKDAKLPDIQTGDILAVFTTGAYGYSMASNYNRIGKPAVVMVKDGKSRIAVKRETYEDLIRNDIQ